MTNEISWTARLASEKARARRLIASRQAIISQTIHETYLGKRGIVNYEAWDIVEQTSAPGAAPLSDTSQLGKSQWLIT